MLFFGHNFALSVRVRFVVPHTTCLFCDFVQIKAVFINCIKDMKTLGIKMHHLQGNTILAGHAII